MTFRGITGAFWGLKKFFRGFRDVSWIFTRISRAIQTSLRDFFSGDFEGF